MSPQLTPGVKGLTIASRARIEHNYDQRGKLFIDYILSHIHQQARVS